MHRVYFVGPSGTGKTTLAQWVSKTYGLPKLPSVARQAIEYMGKTVDDYESVIKDKSAYFIFQQEVMRRQWELECQYWDMKQSFVSDRAFDHIAYTVLYGSQSYVLWPNMESQVRSYSLRGMTMFLVKPCREVLEASLKQGGRKNFLVWEDMNAFYGICKFILETWNIKYEEITNPDLSERKWQVGSLLDAKRMNLE